MGSKLTPQGLVDQGYGKYYGSVNASYTLTNGFGNTGLNVNGVYIPTGCTAVHCWMYFTLRDPNTVGACHMGVRMRVTGGHLTGDGFIGNSGWGFGITMPIRSGGHWATVCEYVNLMNYAGSNDANLQAGYTYNFHLQAKDNANNSIKLAGEGTGTWFSYTPQHMMIMVG